jgi:hypothetical protein
MKKKFKNKNIIISTKAHTKKKKRKSMRLLTITTIIITPNKTSE